MVVVFQFHTCTYPNFTALLEQQFVSHCELMIANEAILTIDVHTRVDSILTLVHTHMYLHDVPLLQYTMSCACDSVHMSSTHLLYKKAFPWSHKLIGLFTTTFGVSHVLCISHTLHTLFMNTVSVDCSLDQQLVSYWCVFLMLTHNTSPHVN